MDDPTPSQQALDRWIHGLPEWGEALVWIAWFAVSMSLIALMLKRTNR